LVVPTYNESHRFDLYGPDLGRFIAAQPPGSELVFVDDGSTDDTVDRIQGFIAQHATLPVRLIRRPHRGKGAAVSAGLFAAEGDIAAFCDLDLATPLAELTRIIDAARKAPILAIGSRGAVTSRLLRRQRRSRELLGRAYNRAVQLLLVPGIVDTQCGAKAASTAVWHKVLPLCREEGFAWDVEAVAVARMLGIAVQEVGIEWRHQEGSKVNPWRDGPQMLRAIPRIRRTLASGLRSRSGKAEGGGAFDQESASVLAESDTEHWWFRSKATFVSLCIRREARNDGWLADVGAGSGGVSALLGWDADYTLVVEGNLMLLREAASRHALVPLAADVARIPLADSVATVVCLLDVIEHLSDPAPTLRDASRILRPDGRLIVNVPAHPRLWSAADEVLGHARRYTRRTLRADLERSGLEVIWMSHVFSWLALPVWAKRRLMPGAEAQLGLDVTSPLVDRLSMLLTRIEWEIVSRIPLPVGTSILCVARRASGATASVPG
jgi:dolichyl-phosphate beta-glucosyltransferase